MRFLLSISIILSSCSGAPRLGPSASECPYESVVMSELEDHIALSLIHYYEDSNFSPDEARGVKLYEYMGVLPDGDNIMSGSESVVVNTDSVANINIYSSTSDCYVGRGSVIVQRDTSHVKELWSIFVLGSMIKPDMIQAYQETRVQTRRVYAGGENDSTLISVLIQQ